ncbi:protein arginine N-methyltransferase 3 [Pseudohyphozyma bogoriensis]|nr:protein arginine N-methyltransferase 3 [Pseudohyphozyma bogoriensis]
MSSVSSGSSASDPADQTWDDWTEEAVPTQSLFSTQTFATPLEALKHDKDVYGVDLVLLASTLGKYFFERIRLINYIRATKPEPKTFARLDRNAAWLQDDAYLKPVLEDDALLQLDFENLSLSSSTPSASAPAASTSEDQDLVSLLRAQLADSNQALEQLKKLYQSRANSGPLDTEVVESVQADKTVVDKEGAGDKGKERDDDSHYFESYAYNEIHEIMLKDKIRTDAYRDFILSNPAIFKDAVVLDVGCGSGILSMFAARCGAKKVYAVDASNVAFKAERNIKENGLDGIITVVKGKVEQIDIPEKVDVIVSEWMGYFLLYECMLDSVLVAKERFMRPGGLMVPSQTSIMLSLFAGESLVKDRITFWENVYGFKMPAMAEEIYDDALIDVVNAGDVVSNEVSLIDIVTGTVTVPELSFTTPFSLTATTKTKVHAFLGHFDTFFTTSGSLVSPVPPHKLSSTEVFFTTGPAGTPTHWKQTVFLLRKPIEVEVGTEVSGVFKCSKNPDNSRELVVEVTWTVGGKEEAQVWKVR